jgi:hypothetical protein
MSTVDHVASVRRVDDDATECRRCGQPIERGRRVAFVSGTGNVHLRCLLAEHQADDTSQETSA